MSITKSYNKHNGTYYAYETTYVWDESAQKKGQKRRCIGNCKPGTDEVIPNGKLGRRIVGPGPDNDDTAAIKDAAARAVSALEKMEQSLSSLLSDARELRESLSEMAGAGRKG